MSPLTNVERGIVKKVVDCFLCLRQSTRKKTLLSEFRQPDAIENMVRCGVIKFDQNNDLLLPTALAFQYCGDQDALKLARNGVTIVLHALLRLFDTELNKKSFTQADVEEQATAIYGPTLDIDAFPIGLYLIPEFGVLKSWSCNAKQELTHIDIADNIVTFDKEKIENAWDEHVRQRSRYIKEGPETPQNAYEQEIMTTSPPHDVPTMSKGHGIRRLMHNPVVIAAIVGAMAVIVGAFIQAYPTLRHGSTPQIRLHIAGTVVDSETNIGIGQAQIMLSGRTETYVTEDNGNFRINVVGNEDEVRRLRIRVNKKGYKTYDESVIPSQDSLVILLEKQ